MLEIYQHKKVFITGHTGFKGSWLMAVFKYLDVPVTGYSLAPGTIPNHYGLVTDNSSEEFADILDKEKLNAAVEQAQPDIIFHLAAQALVRPSYKDPANTYETNVIGTLNVLEAARRCKSVKAIVLITTDKVYENKEWDRPYTENDVLGGYDMYSSSKACCEILISSYRNSFFNIDQYTITHNVLVASVRAGNVIGGGDWSEDRLLPDIAKAASENRKVKIRNPHSVRPWQHVLDCLYGYLQVGAKLLNKEKEFGTAWNFSPFSSEAKNVAEVAAIAKSSWNKIDIDFGKVPGDFHEAGLLVLDNSKAVSKLGWLPVWNTTQAIEKTVEWYRAFYDEQKTLTANNIEEYFGSLKKLNGVY